MPCYVLSIHHFQFNIISSVLLVQSFCGLFCTEKIWIINSWQLRNSHYFLFGFCLISFLFPEFVWVELGPFEGNWSSFYRLDALGVTQPAVSKHRRNIHRIQTFLLVISLCAALNLQSRHGICFS